MKRFLFYTFALLAPLFAMAQQSDYPQYVVFQVTPKTATVVVGDKSVTTDSDGIAVFKLHDGSYRYTVSSKDYHSTSGSFEVSGSKVIKNVELNPAYGWLSVSYRGTTKYNGAKVYVDGVLIGEVPITSSKLSSGIHPVRIVHDQYKIFDELVVIEDGTTYEYSPQLTPRMGKLNITSSPAMANVYVDNEFVGQTPLMVDAVVGEHNISVRKGRFGADPQSATVVENNLTDVNFVLAEGAGGGATSDAFSNMTNNEKTRTNVDFSDGSKDKSIDVKPQAKPAQKAVIEDDQPFVKVEQMPKFKGGGLAEFRNWVMRNVRYPQIAQENGIQGRVLLKFVVEKDGTLTNIQVLQTPDKSLSDEAVRILKTSPKWTPGKQGNKTVRVQYTLPVEFRLQN